MLKLLCIVNSGKNKFKLDTRNKFFWGGIKMQKNFMPKTLKKTHSNLILLKKLH